MLTELPPALLSVPAGALNVPRASLNEIALVLLPLDDTLLNWRFIPVPLPLMLTAPPVVLLICPAVTLLTVALPTFAPCSAKPDELPKSTPWMLLPDARVTVPLIVEFAPL